MQVKRFGVSLENELLEELDKLVVTNQFPNRSQAIRYLIKNNIVEKQWQNDEEVAGAIVIVYDHHKRDLSNQLNHLQHNFHELILAVQHVHLNHHNCIETITVKGKANDLRKLADQIIAIKGIKYGELAMCSSE
jgi:CopG family nickel-responsive transcriptional regulator